MWPSQVLKFYFFLLLVPIFGSKISDRFKDVYEPNTRCLRQRYSQIYYGSTPRGMRLLVEKSMTFHKLNCTTVLIPFQGSGIPDENGTYNGTIGYIQRHEQDIAEINVRPDSLPFEPGKLTNILFPADVTVVSHRNRSRKITREITVFLELDFCVYVYSCVFLFFIFACFYSFVEFFLLANRDVDARQFFNKYLGIFHKVTSLLVDQEQFAPQSITGKVLALSICIFSFVCIFGILLNTIGADLLVKIAPEKIDSLDDLLQNSIQPYIIRALFLYELLKAAPGESKLHQLWLRIGTNGQGLFSIGDFTDHESISSSSSNIINKVLNSTAVLLMPAFMMSAASKTSMCMMFPALENVTSSHQLFAPGMFTGLMSSKIHPYVEKVMNYVSITLLETGLNTGAGRQVPLDLATVSPVLKYNRRAIECGEQITENRADEPTFEPFKLHHMSALFRGYLFMSLSGFVPFFIGLVYAKNKKKFRKNRKAKLTPILFPSGHFLIRRRVTRRSSL